ncbi:hypothetical protein C8J57DRAFT_1464796 [Mycena rebaudengoi]|nr:hypothetical protein C8J57DRAFT_1464796 [Mycena rebaudengoi]
MPRRATACPAPQTAAAATAPTTATTPKSTKTRRPSPKRRASASPARDVAGVKNITRKVIRTLEGLGHQQLLEDEDEEGEVERAVVQGDNRNISTAMDKGKAGAVEDPIRKVDWEIPRKVFHSSIGFITRFTLAVIAPTDFVRLRYPAVERVYERVLGFLMRERSTNGTLWYILGVNFALTFYPIDVAAVAVLIHTLFSRASRTFMGAPVFLCSLALFLAFSGCYFLFALFLLADTSPRHVASLVVREPGSTRLRTRALVSSSSRYRRTAPQRTKTCACIYHFSSPGALLCAWAASLRCASGVGHAVTRRQRASLQAPHPGRPSWGRGELVPWIPSPASEPAGTRLVPSGVMRELARVGAVGNWGRLCLTWVHACAGSSWVALVHHASGASVTRRQAASRDRPVQGRACGKISSTGGISSPGATGLCVRVLRSVRRRCVHALRSGRRSPRDTLPASELPGTTPGLCVPKNPFGGRVSGCALCVRAVACRQ